MPKIVNKAQRREDIALSSTELFIQKGFHNLTVSEVAKNANIAKGTIYEYFKSKEDIVFAIIEYAQTSYDEEVLVNINSTTSIKQKVLFLFDLCIAKGEMAMQRRKMYKEFISVCLDNPSEEMLKFQKDIKVKYISWLRDILKKGIDNKQLKPEALELADGLFSTAEGVLVFSSFDDYNDENSLTLYVNVLFKLIQIGETND